MWMCTSWTVFPVKLRCRHQLPVMILGVDWRSCCCSSGDSLSSSSLNLSHTHARTHTHTHLFLILDPIADIRSEVVTQLKVGSPDEWTQRDQLLQILSYSSGCLRYPVSARRDFNFYNKSKQSSRFYLCCGANTPGHLTLKLLGSQFFFCSQ